MRIDQSRTPKKDSACLSPNLKSNTSYPPNMAGLASGNVRALATPKQHETKSDKSQTPKKDSECLSPNLKSNTSYPPNMAGLASGNVRALATPNRHARKSDMETFCYVGDGKSGMAVGSFATVANG